MGQHQLTPANDSGFFAAKGKLHRNSRVENACYVFETANLSTVWICLVKWVKTHLPFGPGNGQSGETPSLLLISDLGLCQD